MSKLVLTLAIIAAGLAGRSALDKALALRGGAELVALWAQLASVIEVVVGVAAAGVGTGLAVYAARTRRPERQHDFLREALKIGLALGVPVAIAIGLAAAAWADALSGGKLAAPIFALSAAVAWLAIIPVLVNNYWLGQQHRDRMLWLALAAALAPLGAALAAPPAFILHAVVISQAVPALALFVVLRPNGAKPRFRSASHPLRRYVIPGLAIGLLGPASTLIARGVVGEALSWHEVGVLQSLWRLADWVCAFAGGVLSIHYLPRFAQARTREALAAAMLDAARRVLIPSTLVFTPLLVFHRPLLALLYQPGFEPSDLAVALFFGGSLMRIASWIPLFALFALRRTVAVAAGELFSLPLFALVLVLLGNRLSLEAGGAAWLAAYIAYGAFNLWAVRRER